MSHEIEISGDLAAFVSHRELPWHQLGTTTDQVLDVKSALDLAHLSDWNVRKSPLQTVVPVEFDSDGNAIGFERIDIEDKFAVIRDNPFTKGQIDPLGIVGKQYTPVQNEEHGEFLNALVDGGAQIETAGSLKDGKEVFVTMKAPAHMTIGGVDRLDLYVSALNTHDGSKSFRVITTPVRIVCANTQAAALRGAERVFAKRHTAGNGGAVQRAREALELAFDYSEIFEAEAEKMVQESMTNSQFLQIVKDLYPVDDDSKEMVQNRQLDRQNAVMTLFKESPTLKDIKGTRWAGYQAVTEFTDYFTNIAGKYGNAEKVARAEKVFSGEFDGIKEKAFRLLSV